MNTTNKKYIGLGIAVLAIGLIFYLGGMKSEEAGTGSSSNSDGTALSAPNTPPTSTAPKTQASSGPVIKGGVYIISYENSGFKPASLEIKRGAPVRFVNNSSKAMKIGSIEGSTAAYQYLTQPKSVGRGAMYELNFNDVGVFKYVNLNDSNDRGTITIK